MDLAARALQCVDESRNPACDPPTQALSGHSSFESTDEMLLLNIYERQTDALDQLYTRYGEFLSEIAVKVVHDSEDAQEVVQDVFLEVWRGARRFDTRRGKVKGWLAGLTHCRAIDRYRKLRRCAEAHHRIASAADDFLALKTNPLPVVTDETQMLKETMSKLPSEQQMVVSLIYFSGMSQRESAKHIGLSLGIVKHRLVLAMRTMREHLDGLRDELSYG